MIQVIKRSPLQSDPAAYDRAVNIDVKAGGCLPANSFCCQLLHPPVALDSASQPIYQAAAMNKSAAIS
jgi:hypothetical protein